MAERILDLGCGQKKVPNAWGVDLNRRSRADVICNLERYPYPFLSNTFDLVVCDNVLEHLSDIIAAMREIHRLLKPGGRVLIIVPHFSSDDSYADVTHKHSLSLRAFDEFFPNTSAFDYYVPFKYECVFRKIVFGRFKRMIGISWFANRFYRIYETHLTFIFQAHHIEFLLKAIK